MKSFTSSDYGRIVVMHLGKGDRLLESVSSECARLGVKNAILLSAIGSLRRMSIHVIKSITDDPENEYITVEAPLELGAAQGLILDGVPHFHVVCSAPGGRNYAGHLEDGTEVQYLVELSLMEVKDINLTRKKDAFGIVYIGEK